MKYKVLLAAGFMCVILIFPRPAHAIIFLPALILIPIAKLVALIIGGLSIPALSLGTLWSNLTQKSLKRTILVIIVGLLLVAIIAAIILKLENPARPLF